jgi:hypothetical protein
MLAKLKGEIVEILFIVGFIKEVNHLIARQAPHDKPTQIGIIPTEKTVKATVITLHFNWSSTFA